MTIARPGAILSLVALLFGVTRAIALDYSANQPALPNIGANFGGSGPYANYVLLATVPSIVTNLRDEVEIENQSTGQVIFVIDDGAASAGFAPVNPTIDVLAAASVAGGQGGYWNSSIEHGRIQVYAPSSAAQVSIRTR